MSSAPRWPTSISHALQDRPLPGLQIDDAEVVLVVLADEPDVGASGEVHAEGAHQRVRYPTDS